MIDQTFAVQGMTCGHCARAVTREVQGLAGVNDVHVDVDAGTLLVRADAAVPTDLVRTAVDEAGYTLVVAP